MVDLFGALSRANTQPNSFIAWIGVDHAADSAQGPWDRRNLVPMIPDFPRRVGYRKIWNQHKARSPIRARFVSIVGELGLPFAEFDSMAPLFATGVVN